MPFTEAQKEQIRKDYMDPEKVAVYCEEHFYMGPSKTNRNVKPHPGCKKCWFVFFLCDIATTPPHQRYERLQELSEVVHKTVELVEQGKFDFEPHLHPQVEIEKEA